MDGPGETGVRFGRKGPKSGTNLTRKGMNPEGRQNHKGLLFLGFCPAMILPYRYRNSSFC